ncbi:MULTISPECIES: hypothetical protein [Micromonospora]|uniref:Uncharacterized protein n=1 Tax=Micromonospora sicca TaxID=2202420 RepID=A0A317DN33_9ACTN|nr:MULTISPECIES: hypothetical protein [unclassified Micromonospora]MBM0225850.1 hypothetical protein [Micromonospora sp. ATA51]PWR14193.1 hypothetical protein DKT69_17475 [Micromonospora sp. 4G51]
MRLFPKPDARFRAAAATLAAVALLVTMLIWRPEGIPAVVLSLLLVLLAMTAGVAVTAARESRDARPAASHQPPGQPLPAGYGVDADTLEALDPRAVRDLRGLDADTLEALDPRAVRDSRSVNGVSDR